MAGWLVGVLAGSPSALSVPPLWTSSSRDTFLSCLIIFLFFSPSLVYLEMQPDRLPSVLRLLNWCNQPWRPPLTGDTIRRLPPVDILTTIATVLLIALHFAQGLQHSCTGYLVADRKRNTQMECKRACDGVGVG